MNEQYVCTVCGYNMVGFHPANCPFCGAPQNKFLTAEECSRTYRVESTKVTSEVMQLRSTPRLGYEHAAYRLETGGKTFWVDCPSCFDKSLEQADTITFTHHHFLGASNMYRNHFEAVVQINGLDTENKLAERFTFDRKFSGDFSDSGLEAFHINGHTLGFTIYVYNDVLFVCDYVFSKPGSMKLNPYGPEKQTREGSKLIGAIAEAKNISYVCGYNYVEKYSQWRPKFDRLTGN